MSKKANANLNQLRKRIDRADRALLKALQVRFETVQSVAEVKRVHGLPALQKSRWKEVQTSRMELGKSLGLREKFMRSLLKLLHKESLSLQRRKTKK
jgi:chorismate mutase